MRIVARSTLAAFCGKHPQAEGPLENWIRVCAKARWSTTADIKTAFGSKVDFLPRNRVVFDLGGNKYRLIVVVLLRRGAIYIRFIGTHAEYDRVDASTVQGQSACFKRIDDHGLQNHPYPDDPRPQGCAR